MKYHRLWFAVLGMSIVWICGPARAQQRQVSPASTGSTTSNEPAVRSEYGVVPGRRDFNTNNPEHFVRDAGYPPGVFAVSIPDRTQLLAFDVNSNGAAICNRIDSSPVTISNRGGNYFRFRCPDSVDSREVVFLDSTEIMPKYAVQLEWTALAGPSPLPMPRATPAGDLHDYAVIASPGFLDGRYLVSEAWFAGEYLPRKEIDQLRGDTIAVGHYQLLDRTLFIGESPKKPSIVLYESKEPVEVREGIEWAFLPKNASEKTQAAISTLYEIPNGYMVRVSMLHDHEGFGVDESTYFYAWQMGRWRLLAKAENTRLY